MIVCSTTGMAHPKVINTGRGPIRKYENLNRKV